MTTFYKLFAVVRFYTIYFALSEVDSASKEKIMMRTERFSVLCVIEQHRGKPGKQMCKNNSKVSDGFG